MKGFELKPTEVAKLKERHQAERRQWAADRIKAIVLLGTNWTLEATSEALLMNTKTLRGYVEHYQQGGLAKLLTRQYKGRKSILSKSQQQSLRAHLSEHTYTTISQIISYIKKAYSITLKSSRVREIIKDLGFVYKKPKQVPGKVDLVGNINFLHEYQQIRKTGKPLYFTDGVHPQHNSQPNYGWMLSGKTKALPSNTGRKRLNINGLLNIDTHELIVRTDTTVNAQSTIKLFKQLLKRHKDEEEIYVISDNAGYYRSKLVREYLEQTQKIKLIYLPAYSPHLNLIERVWKHFKKKVVYNKYYERFSDFKRACLNYFRRNHRKDFETLLTEKFHFEKNVELLKLAI